MRPLDGIDSAEFLEQGDITPTNPKCPEALFVSGVPCPQCADDEGVDSHSTILLLTLHPGLESSILLLLEGMGLEEGGSTALVWHCDVHNGGCLCGLVTDDDIRFEGIRRDRLLHKDILAILADGSDDSVKDGVMTFPDQASTGEAVVEHMPKRLLLNSALPAGGIPHPPQPLGHCSHWQQIQPGSESELVLGKGDVSASRDPVARGRVKGDAVEGPALIRAGKHLLETSSFLGPLQHGCHRAPVWSSGADTVELHSEVVVHIPQLNPEVSDGAPHEGPHGADVTSVGFTFRRGGVQECHHIIHMVWFLASSFEDGGT